MGRRKPRPVGRPPLIGDQQIHKNLLDALRLGVPISVACQAANISESVFYKWTSRGRDEHEAREDDQEPLEEEQPYLDLYLEVRQARATAAVRNVGVIQKVAQGGTVTETTKETLPDGTVRETVKRQPPDWRAAAWYLERSHRGEYGKDATQVEISGAGGGPIQVSVDAEDLSARLTRHLAAGVATVPALGPGDDTNTEDVTVEGMTVDMIGDAVVSDH